MNVKLIAATLVVVFLALFLALLLYRTYNDADPDPTQSPDWTVEPTMSDVEVSAEPTTPTPPPEATQPTTTPPTSPPPPEATQPITPEAGPIIEYESEDGGELPATGGPFKL